MIDAAHAKRVGGSLVPPGNEARYFPVFQARKQGKACVAEK